MTGTSPSARRARALRPSGWNLRTKLVASIVLLYLAVTLVTGAATVLGSRTSQLSQMDEQLRSAALALEGGDAGKSGPPPGLGLSQVTCTVAQDGTIVQRVVDGSLASTCYVSGTDGSRIDLTQRQVETLMRTLSPQQSAGPVTRAVDGSDYRVVTAQRSGLVRTREGTEEQTLTEVRGLPLAPVQESVDRLVRTVALVGLFGLLFIVLASWLLVRRNLAPLRRVAGTARRVSHLPLAEGAAQTSSERVAPADTDPGTEVGQVGVALNELLDHVDRSLTARHRSELQVRQFVADASHELRTPLASIRGYAELSRKEPEPVPEGVVHALGRIEAEADRMTELVEDLLLLARLDAGRPLAQDPVDLTMVVMETVSDARAAGPDHRWALELPDEPAEVVGDEARLRQVLINVLANARTHTPPGTLVTTAIRPVPGGVELRVTDTGPGVPPQLQARVFERFTRGDAARQRAGGSSGLGLSIVHAVVSAHGGRVGLTSRPGETTVTIALPATPPPLAPPPPAAPPGPAPA